MTLFYAITVSTEEQEVIRLIQLIKENTDDKIVVQCDTTKVSSELVDTLHTYEVDLIYLPFENDFASFKNNLNEYCEKNGADYVFQLDADEMLSAFLIKNVKEIIEANSEVELFFIPRINTVDGITMEHIEKWKWNLDKSGRINFPDYQGRVYRSNLKWANKVHERIIGVKHYSIFPLEEEYCINHHKSIIKQEFQNTLYNEL